MVTIKDVAKYAGVSVATVSNALTENRSVGAETKEKVLRVAKELNYSPNMMASSMVTKKTNIIGVFLYNFVEKNFRPYSEFLKGVTQTCQRKGQRVLVYTDVTQAQFRAGFVMGHEPMDAGIIFFPQEDEFRAKDLENACLPFVFVGKCKDFSFVDCENRKLTKRMTNKLIEAGHRKICFFNSNKNWMLTKDRHDGFFSALKGAGISETDCLEYQLDENDNLETLFLEACAKGYRAFVVESPKMVRVVYEYCKKNHLQVGKDVSLVFLGYDPQFEFVTPSLVSARLSYEKLGEKALELLEKLSVKSKPCEYYLDPEIIDGDSVATVK